jgi:hypothetical protein
MAGARRERELLSKELYRRAGLRQGVTSFSAHFKDIVQPKKRGVERGTIRTVLTSYTIADIF